MTSCRSSNVALVNQWLAEPWAQSVQSTVGEVSTSGREVDVSPRSATGALPRRQIGARKTLFRRPRTDSPGSPRELSLLNTYQGWQFCKLTP